MTNVSKIVTAIAFPGFVLGAVLAFGVFVGIANAQESDFEPYGGYEPYSNDFEPYYNDFEPYSNEFEPYYNDFEPYSNDFEPYSNDFEPYYNDFEPYSNDFEPYSNDFEPYTNDFEPYNTDFEAYGCDYGCFQQDGIRYSTPGCTGCGSYSQPPVRVSAPPSYSTPSPTPRPIPPQPPAPRPQPTPSSNVANNTCVNNSCNSTLVDNSINGSFNDNSINGSFNTVALAPVTPQRPIQYVFPQQNLSCVIVATPNSVQSGQATTLSWSSIGASSAWLSDGLGTVPVNGSRVVNPISSRTYTLTISGLGGTQTCITYVTVGSMAPYVSLSQIPYTGFGGGPLENAIYFGGVLAFALSAAYLVLYFKGGAGSVLAGLANLFPAKALIASSAFASPAMFSSTKLGAGSGLTPLNVQKADESEDVERLPSLNTGSAPKDSMSFAHGANGGIPRIVVTRS